VSAVSPAEFELTVVTAAAVLGVSTPTENGGAAACGHGGSM
jgi:hypothetical protein